MPFVEISSILFLYGWFSYPRAPHIYLLYLEFQLRPNFKLVPCLQGGRVTRLSISMEHGTQDARDTLCQNSKQNHWLRQHNANVNTTTKTTKTKKQSVVYLLILHSFVGLFVLIQDIPVYPVVSRLSLLFSDCYCCWSSNSCLLGRERAIKFRMLHTNPNSSQLLFLSFEYCKKKNNLLWMDYSLILSMARYDNVAYCELLILLLKYSNSQ